jgi:hypothetical protein
MSSWHGINTTAFVVPWSVTVSIESFFLDSGSFTIKSTLMVLKGSGTPFGVMGWSGGTFG